MAVTHPTELQAIACGPAGRELDWRTSSDREGEIALRTEAAQLLRRSLKFPATYSNRETGMPGELRLTSGELLHMLIAPLRIVSEFMISPSAMHCRWRSERMQQCARSFTNRGIGNMSSLLHLGCITTDTRGSIQGSIFEGSLDPITGEPLRMFEFAQSITALNCGSLRAKANFRVPVIHRRPDRCSPQIPSALYELGSVSATTHATFLQGRALDGQLDAMTSEPLYILPQLG